MQNENNAAAACVSLRRSRPVYISIEKPGMDAERSDNADSADEDPGIVQVYAGNVVGVVKTSSPTSDALDSAEVIIWTKHVSILNCSPNKRRARLNL